MSKKLTINDWELLSAYLDEKLSPAENTRIEALLETVPEFKKSLKELTYTRHLLRSLPQKRAPRNFTLSPEQNKHKTPIRNLWLQPALSFVSIAAAVALVAIFTGTYLMRGAGLAKPVAYAPEMAADSSNQAAESNSNPVIINWVPVFATGKGGGGGGTPEESGVFGGGAGGAGEAVIQTLPESPFPVLEPTLESLTAPLPTTAPETITRSIDQSDLSTMILGLPNPADEGKIVESEPVRQARADLPLNIRTILMVISGVIAVLTGAAALILRRR